MWYGNSLDEITKITCSFSDLDCVYRGNLYIGDRIVGDYVTADSLKIEKTFNVKFCQEDKMKYEKLAQELCNAIRKLAADEDSLNNFESYLTSHFDTWLRKFASTPEGLTSELKLFSEMYDNK